MNLENQSCSPTQLGTTKDDKIFRNAGIPVETAPNEDSTVGIFSVGMGMEDKIPPKQARRPERGSSPRPRYSLKFMNSLNYP